MKQILFVLLFFMSTVGLSWQLIKIPLTKHERKLSEVKSWSKVSSSNASSIVEKLSNLGSPGQYYGVVGFETPFQLFRVLLDTTSAQLIIPSSECKDAGCSNHCQYRASLSRTYSNGSEHWDSYGTGIVDCLFSRDLFTIGKCELNQVFCLTSSERGAVFQSNSMFDGTLGLAWPGLGWPTTPVFQNLINTDFISQPLFSFYYNHEASGVDTGELILGGSNPERYDVSSVKPIPVSEKLYWTINIDKITLKDKDINRSLISGGSSAIIHTGTTMITGPENGILKVFQFIGADMEHYKDKGIALVDCDKVNSLPPISFNIGGQEYIMEGKDYIWKVTNDEAGKNAPNVVCTIGFQTTRLVPLSDKIWILGELFLRKYYTIFDFGNGTVSFANLK